MVFLLSKIVNYTAMPIKIKYISFFFIFLIASSFSFAQVKTSIRGNVVDEKGAPIFAASIYLNNS